jgi:hypothetical protein
MKYIAIIALLHLPLCLGCRKVQSENVTLPASPTLIPKQSDLLWHLSENGVFEVKIESYDPMERIVHVSMPQPTPPYGRRSMLAHEFADGASLPYQFDGTNWIPLWSPSLRLPEM